MGEMLPDSVPVECSFSADVEPFHPVFQKAQAGVEIEWGAWPAKYASTQSGQPTGPDIVDGKITGDAKFSEVFRADGLAVAECSVEIV